MNVLLEELGTVTEAAQGMLVSKHDKQRGRQLVMFRTGCAKAHLAPVTPRSCIMCIYTAKCAHLQQADLVDRPWISAWLPLGVNAHNARLLQTRMRLNHKLQGVNDQDCRRRQGQWQIACCLLCLDLGYAVRVQQLAKVQLEAILGAEIDRQAQLSGSHQPLHQLSLWHQAHSVMAMLGLHACGAHGRQA